MTVCPAGWRRGIVYRYCRDLERGKGERLADNGLVPRLLISWRRACPFFFFFSPPAHRPTPGVDQMGWKRVCALLASRSARAKQGFFSQISTWRRGVSSDRWEEDSGRVLGGGRRRLMDTRVFRTRWNVAAIIGPNF